MMMKNMQKQNRPGFLGVVDRIPLSEFKKLDLRTRAEIMAEAFRAKKNFERSTIYMQELFEHTIGKDGIRSVVAQKAAEALTDANRRWQHATYLSFWANYGPEDMDEIDTFAYTMKEGMRVPYYHKIDWFVINKDNPVGLFVLREQIDGYAPGGRQFKCQAFRVELDGTTTEVARDTAWENWEGRASIRLAGVRGNTFILQMRDGTEKEV